jgi:hypothetical protein
MPAGRADGRSRADSLGMSSCRHSACQPVLISARRSLQTLLLCLLPISYLLLHVLQEFSVSSRRASAVSTTLLTASPSQSTTSLHDPTLGTDSDNGGGEGLSDGHQLSRTVSMRSTASGVSASGSVASSSVTASGITKRIVPLWNLDFHVSGRTFQAVREGNIDSFLA